MLSIWESRNVWLPMEINEEDLSLEVVWHDVYDLDVYVSNPTPMVANDTKSRAERPVCGRPSRAKRTCPRTRSWREMYSSRRL